MSMDTINNLFSDAVPFILHDTDFEEKFEFRLTESLDKAAAQGMLTDYKIHATKGVRPLPADMKGDISTYIPPLSVLPWKYLPIPTLRMRS